MVSEKIAILPGDINMPGVHCRCWVLGSEHTIHQAVLLSEHRQKDSVKAKTSCLRGVRN